MSVEFVTYELSIGEVDVNIHMLDFNHNPFIICKTFDTLKEGYCFVDYVTSHFPTRNKKSF